MSIQVSFHVHCKLRPQLHDPGNYITTPDRRLVMIALDDGEAFGFDEKQKLKTSSRILKDNL